MPKEILRPRTQGAPWAPTLMLIGALAVAAGVAFIVVELVLGVI